MAQREALQPERTELAWHRTVMACALAAIPMSVAHLIDRRYGMLLVTAMVILAIGLSLGPLTARSRQISERGWHHSPWPRLVGVSVAVGAVASLGVATALMRLVVP
ncbi:DUF202 domain-containing protein [Demetria terragena]|uniref:DUF202 domain-containing protein n=1 Tax=Demetria terragena TaxID=63959 RepID=UPI000378FEC6|nr:DUF202 domain-containing protein [Demetria terragena]